MKSVIVIAILLITVPCLSIAQNFVEIKGKVVDKDTKRPLEYCTIKLVSKAIGTISNSKGEFTLKFKSEGSRDSILISHLGYSSIFVPTYKSNEPLIELSENSTLLEEVVILPYSAEELIRRVIVKNFNNYQNNFGLLKGFYKEKTLFHVSAKRKQGNQSETKAGVSYAEAVIEINKNHNKNKADVARLIKGRLINEEDTSKANPTPIVSLSKLYNAKGGVTRILKNDIAKDPEEYSFFSPGSLRNYDYELEGITSYDSVKVFIISFDQKDLERPLYMGKIYIEENSLAIVRVDFQYSPKGLEYIKKFKFGGIGIEYLNEGGVIIYQQHEGRWYLKYSKIARKLHFTLEKNFKEDIDMDESIELLITDIENLKIKNFNKNEIFRNKDQLSNKLSDYDPNFWENYNVLK